MNLSVAYNDFAIQLQKHGYIDHAEENYRKAISLDAANMAAWSNIGTCLSGKGLHTEALEAYEKAIELDPTLSAAHSNISVIYADRGENDKAVAALRKALELQPDFVVAHSNLICQLDLSPDQDTAALQAERRKWAEAHANVPRWVHEKPEWTNRKLRIGYVSSDIRQHSACYAFGAMLKHYDPEQFEVFAYYNYPIYDPTTEQLEQGVNWRDICQMSDDDAAGQIAHDKIDILVDLNGHSAHNRLLVFARKPAPIQITAWGYLGGTGMSQMDYMLADQIMVPQDERDLYAEKILDLECATNICFRAEFPPVNALPALTGQFTFGSFNRLPKVTPEMFKAWGRIMAQVPGSRLLMKTGELDDEGTRDEIIAQLKAVGIDQRRVRMMGRTKWEQHVEAFREVDVCLDTFPHGGGVTTMETLMMGVPVVAMDWPTLSGRVSASILCTVGLGGWVAPDVDGYVACAVEASKDLNSLAWLRKTLRGRMEESTLCNARKQVEAVEALYRKVWQDYCR